ncbi:unnamed protein product [Owenia fusiformis]|uniref:Lysosomal enzyme trafficking factor n=1 Tax=Owenia fusiformis TaxID=6347 RepID=A0A8J1U3N3_OWEFU|nr:unnamed protein product [Owenia fusiformis]
MQFRQRMAWLMVIIFLAGTCGIVYYIFDVSEQFNQFALDHVQKYHQGIQEDESELSYFRSFMRHLTDIPLPLWMLLFSLPYLQVFCMLLACTKPEPRFSLAFLWPIYFYIKCRYLWCGQNSFDKAVNSTKLNGHTLILET